MTSNYKLILDAVQDVVQALELTGIADANVVVGKTPTDGVQLLPSKPGVIIAPFGRKTFEAGTNASDYVGYPILIATVAASNQDQTTNLDRNLQWTEDIRQAFHNKRLAAVAAVYKCLVEGDSDFDAQAYRALNLDVAVIPLRVFAKETTRP